MRPVTNLTLFILVVLIAFSFVQPVFSQQDTSFMGTILSISPSFESLEFFEKTVGLSANTVVLNESGIRMTVQDLTPGLLVWVETSKGSKGIANRIIIQKLRRE